MRNAACSSMHLRHVIFWETLVNSAPLMRKWCLCYGTTRKIHLLTYIESAPVPQRPGHVVQHCQSFVVVVFVVVVVGYFKCFDMLFISSTSRWSVSYMSTFLRVFFFSPQPTRRTRWSCCAFCTTWVWTTNSSPCLLSRTASLWYVADRHSVQKNSADIRFPAVRSFGKRHIR